MSQLLEDLLREEEELQFKAFDEFDAWKLGSLLVDRARKDSLPIAIDITLSGRQLFHASLPGASQDNDAWIKRKINLVNRFGHSSFYMGRYLASVGKKIEEAFLVSETEFAPHGGSFPLILAGTGAIGAVTVSGLPQEEDHKLVVWALRSLIAKEK
jgi:uncharacterized protein (UPF0303 family)